MVLGAKLTRFLLFAFLLFAASMVAFSEPPPVDSDAVEISGHTIRLDGDKCILEVSRSDSDRHTFDLEMDPPCFYSRSDGDVQSFKFEEVGVDSVIIVIGTPLGESQIEKWDLSESVAKSCGSQHRGVIISGEEVWLSEEMFSGGVACRDFGVDQKSYWSYAHEEQ